MKARLYSFRQVHLTDCELLLSSRVYHDRNKTEKLTLTLSLSLHGIGISPLHIITHNHRYQPDAERERERTEQRSMA